MTLVVDKNIARQNFIKLYVDLFLVDIIGMNIDISNDNKFQENQLKFHLNGLIKREIDHLLIKRLVKICWKKKLHGLQ